MTYENLKALQDEWRAFSVRQRLTSDQYIRGSELLDSDPEYYSVHGWPALERAATAAPPPKPEVSITRV